VRPSSVLQRLTQTVKPLLASRKCFQSYSRARSIPRPGPVHHMSGSCVLSVAALSRVDSSLCTCALPFLFPPFHRPPVPFFASSSTNGVSLRNETTASNPSVFAVCLCAISGRPPLSQQSVKFPRLYSLSYLSRHARRSQGWTPDQSHPSVAVTCHLLFIAQPCANRFFTVRAISPPQVLPGPTRPFSAHFGGACDCCTSFPHTRPQNPLHSSALYRTRGNPSFQPSTA